MSKALPALVFKSHDGRCASEAVTAAQNTAGCCTTTAAVRAEPNEQFKPVAGPKPAELENAQLPLTNN
jgi:hypothetical protein